MSDPSTQLISASKPIMSLPAQGIPSNNQGNLMTKILPIIILLVLAGAGTATGWSLNKLVPSKMIIDTSIVAGAPGTISADKIQVGKIYGIEDDKKFPDVSEGVIEKGGMDGEGSHHLVRPGGKSQTVYMTSSTVDLDLFAGDKVQVKGQTFSAQKAAWFMDVGAVKVIELNVSSGESASPSATTE